MSRPRDVACWAIVSGEYPPDPGGVSDHSRHLAEGLAARGYRVAVFAPGRAESSCTGSPSISRLPRGFALTGFSDLGRRLDALPNPRRILVQYVPHALGMRSMNVPLCLWLRGRREPMDVMFHEVAVQWGLDRSLRHNVLGATHRVMARLVADMADRVFVSTSAWTPLLRGLGVRSRIRVLPVPSNLPADVDAERAASIRARLDVAGEKMLVGHFGTFSPLYAPMLATALDDLLGMVPRTQVMVVGRGGAAFVRDLASKRPELAQRLLATGHLPPATAAEHLAACDLLLQPFPDGVTTRRTTVMAGLSLGVPIVTTRGALTESLWTESAALALASGAGEMAAMAAALLAEPERLKALGARGAVLYRNQFQAPRTIDTLVGDWDD